MGRNIAGCRVFGEDCCIFHLPQCPPPGRAFHPASCNICPIALVDGAEDLARKLPIDDCYSGRFLSSCHVKSSARQQSCARRMKVSRRDLVT